MRSSPAPLDMAKTEAYLRSLVTSETPAMARVREAYEQEGLPNVEPEVGQALEVLACGANARRVLEVGCCLGYSALWLARAVGPTGVVDTIEFDPATAKRARENFRNAGVADVVTVHEGAALDVLPTLSGPYDLVFLDADKREYADYLDHTLRLLRPGGLVLADNVLWSGRVYDPDAKDDDTNGVRRFTEAITTRKGLHTTLLPIGDGLSVTVVAGP